MLLILSVRGSPIASVPDPIPTVIGADPTPLPPPPKADGPGPMLAPDPGAEMAPPVPYRALVMLLPYTMLAVVPEVGTADVKVLPVTAPAPNGAGAVSVVAGEGEDRPTRLEVVTGGPPPYRVELGESSLAAASPRGPERGTCGAAASGEVGGQDGGDEGRRDGAVCAALRVKGTCKRMQTPAPMPSLHSNPAVDGRPHGPALPSRLPSRDLHPFHLRTW